MNTHSSCNADTPSKLFLKINGNAKQLTFKGSFYMHVEEAIHVFCTCKGRFLPTAEVKKVRKGKKIEAHVQESLL